jgi:mRNA-degrading endonuclease RelE of RelBE toxin-antitoxin system
MEIFIHDSARKFLDGLDPQIQAFIKEDLKKLAENPYSNRLDTKKVKGLGNRPDLFRMRVGKYRIIYFIQQDKVWITEIMRREHGYDL